MELKKAVFNWSGGKDSALALQKVIQGKEYDIVSLLTTVNCETRQSSMHNIPVELLQRQADSIGIPLYIALLPSGELTGYEDTMLKAILHFREQDVKHFIFGDIHLHDVKSYREEKLNPYNIEIVEPLWNKTSEEIINEFISSGLKTKIVVTQADKLDVSYVGREIDRDTIASFPKDIDVCGENGEYHTFCYDGPMFRYRVDFQLNPPQKKTYSFKMDTGDFQEFSYWIGQLTV